MRAIAENQVAQITDSQIANSQIAKKVGQTAPKAPLILLYNLIFHPTEPEQPVITAIDKRLSCAVSHLMTSAQLR